ncbi:MAG: hypothetical protein Q7Q71_08420 [Verrucomicrobiota bacterium JB023]|nr:hypothetical protein [Verrucomicrobiota bacterium JB023]
MSLRVICFALVFASIALVSCGGRGEVSGEEAAEVKKRPKVVGVVSSIHADKGFILIRQYGPGDMPTGGVYSARSADGRRAVAIFPTGESQGKFHAADYAADAGIPRVGDVVIMSPIETENSETRQEALPENVEGEE